MESRAKLFGHPLHQQLVALPIGMLVLGVLADLVALFGGGAPAAAVAYWAIGAGIVTAIVAFSGAALAAVTAWLGGEPVTRLGIGVSDRAHADAPSSLDGPVPARSQDDGSEIERTVSPTASGGALDPEAARATSARATMPTRR